MAVFYSFHYGPDFWRVQQIRNIGAVGDNDGAVGAQDWERVRYKSDSAIQQWIDEQMEYKRAVVVLIGKDTAARQWVQYEIQRAWDLKKPLLGVRIHGLRDQRGQISVSGEDPFQRMGYCQVPVFDPQGSDSKSKYANITSNLSQWISQGYRRP